MYIYKCIWSGVRITVILENLCRDNNVLKLWKFALEDLKRLGVKTFQPRYVWTIFLVTSRFLPHFAPCAARTRLFRIMYTQNRSSPPPPPQPISTYIIASRARNYRPCFRENQPKRSFSIKWKRAFLACFRENWVYKFGHRWDKWYTEPIFLNVYGAQKSIPRNEFRQPMYSSLAGRDVNHIPPRFLAPIYCLKIPAQDRENWR